MSEKTGKNDGKKYDGFAIASFVLIIIVLLLNVTLIKLIMKIPYLIMNTLTIPNLLSIILGIIGLVRIHKNENLKGKGFAWAGIIISILLIIFLLIFIYFRSNI